MGDGTPVGILALAGVLAMEPLVLLATHDLHMARTWAGRVVADGPPQHVFSDAATLEHTGLGAIVGEWERAGNRG